MTWAELRRRILADRLPVTHHVVTVFGDHPLQRQVSRAVAIAARGPINDQLAADIAADRTEHDHA